MLKYRFADSVEPWIWVPLTSKRAERFFLMKMSIAQFENILARTRGPELLLSLLDLRGSLRLRCP